MNGHGNNGFVDLSRDTDMKHDTAEAYSNVYPFQPAYLSMTVTPNKKEKPKKEGKQRR